MAATEYSVLVYIYMKHLFNKIIVSGAIGFLQQENKRGNEVSFFEENKKKEEINKDDSGYSTVSSDSSNIASKDFTND